MNKCTTILYLVIIKIIVEKLRLFLVCFNYLKTKNNFFCFARPIVSNNPILIISKISFIQVKLQDEDGTHLT